MHKFLTCGLIAAIALIHTTLTVCAEPPPAEPVIVTTCSATAASCVQ